jgi:hypothetical protein
MPDPSALLNRAAASVILLVATLFLAGAVLIFRTIAREMRRARLVVDQARQLLGGPGPCMKTPLRNDTGQLPIYGPDTEPSPEAIFGIVSCALRENHGGRCLVDPAAVIAAGFHPAPF